MNETVGRKRAPLQVREAAGVVCRDGVDTLLALLLSRLGMRQPLEDLVASHNEVLLGAVEGSLQSKGDLHALALLLASHDRAPNALDIWKVGLPLIV